MNDDRIITPLPDVVPGWYEPDVNEINAADQLSTITVEEKAKEAVTKFQYFIQKNMIWIEIIQIVLMLIVLFKISKIKK